MNDNETRSLAVEKVVSACKQKVIEVIVLEGRDHSDWCEAYIQHGIPRVTHVAFNRLDQLVALEEALDEGTRIVHVTQGLPAASLNEAEQSVNQVAQIADHVVFSPLPVSRQEVQDLLISWPSFWAMLFLAEGFLLRDVIRPALWNDFYSDWKTLQSTVLFSNGKHFDDWSRSNEGDTNPVIDYIHPSILEESLKDISTLRSSMMEILKEGNPLSNETDNPSSGIYLALPKRYSKKKYEKKLLQERRRWWKVALFTPWRVTYWGDLWRLQRRTKRLTRSG